MSFGNQIYLICSHYLTVLHPRHKLTYFRNAGWESEWITTAEKLVRDEFNRSYANKDVPVDAPPTGAGEDSSTKVCIIMTARDTRLTFVTYT
jgi:hypothetical protein